MSPFGPFCLFGYLLTVAWVAAQPKPPFAPLGPNVTLKAGTVMPSIGLGSSGACHPDPDGTEQACPNYNATMSAIQVGYRYALFVGMV